MRAKFIGSKARIFCPSTDPATYADLSLGVDFDTDQQRVTMEWYWNAPGGAQSYHSVETHTLSFAPTAFCTEAGAGPVMYLAGYIERSGHVVVEKWTIEDLRLGATAPQDDEDPVLSTLSQSISKQVIVMSSAVGPLRSIVYHLPQQRLWMLEEEAPNTLWRVDPEAGAPEKHSDSNTLPSLAQTFSMKSVMIKATAPGGGGFVIELLTWRAWKPKWSTPNKLLLTDPLFLMRDVNQDGVTDEAVLTDFNDIQNVRQYYEHEDYDYH